MQHEMYDSVSPHVFYHSLRTLSLLLAPMAPHIAAEMWHILFGLQANGDRGTSWSGSVPSEHVFAQPWPVSPLSATELEAWHGDDKFDVTVCINGKKAGTMAVRASDWRHCQDAENVDLSSTALELVRQAASTSLRARLEGIGSDTAVQKVIVVPANKLINIIAPAAAKSKSK